MIVLDKNPFVTVEKLENGFSTYNSLDGSSYQLKYENIDNYDELISNANEEQQHKLIENGILVYKDTSLNALCLTTKVRFPFFGLKLQNFSNPSSASIGIIGAPYGFGNSKGSGSANSPAALRASSRNYFIDFKLFYSRTKLGLTSLGWPSVKGNYGDEVSVADFGDILAYDFESQSDIFNRIQSVIGVIINRGVVPFVIGGDHSITLPILRANRTKYESLHLVQFDAHTDNYKSRYDNALSVSNVSHANFISHAINEAIVDSVTQIGIRGIGNISTNVSETHIITASNFDPQIDLIAGSDIYISIDVDVLDPMYMFATGHLVPHGLSVCQLYKMIDYCFEKYNVVGVDVVEFDPSKSRGNYDVDICLELIIFLVDRLNYFTRARNV